MGIRNGIALTAFTPQGRELAERLAAAMGGRIRGAEQPLAVWTREAFCACEALIFVGAAGIAVRAVAPYVRSKTGDPAVLCVDEQGRWVIPMLSGHLGGANALAREIAGLIGGEAVITTATDLNGVFAVDLWANAQGMYVLQPERIRQVSGKILRGKEVRIRCPFPVKGMPPERVVLLGEPGLCRPETKITVTSVGTAGGNPEGAAEEDVLVSYREYKTAALQLVPRVLSLGVGCRRGIAEAQLEDVFQRFCAERGICPQAVVQIASADRKQDEAGLILFCDRHGWSSRWFSAGELRGVEGNFSSSGFVEQTVGVDNVCERACVLASGGRLVETKYARDGVTFALAERSAIYDWRM